MTSVRDYEEQQFFEEMRAYIPDEAFRSRIENLYERDHTAIERQENELHNAYKSAHSALEATSKLAGLEVDELLTVVGRASAFMSLSWYQVLDIVRAYYVQLNQLRKEQKEKK